MKKSRENEWLEYYEFVTIHRGCLFLIEPSSSKSSFWVLTINGSTTTSTDSRIGPDYAPPPCLLLMTTWAGCVQSRNFTENNLSNLPIYLDHFVVSLFLSKQFTHPHFDVVCIQITLVIVIDVTTTPSIRLQHYTQEKPYMRIISC